MKTKILLSLFIISLISSIAFAQPPVADPAKEPRYRYEAAPRDREPVPPGWKSSGTGWQSCSSAGPRRCGWSALPVPLPVKYRKLP